jgi:Mn-dependent DtxR family transcriptional regulator
VSDERKEEGGEKSPFADLDEMQQEIAKRIRDNQRFLEKFLDDDFLDDDGEGTEEESGEQEEEL